MSLLSDRRIRSPRQAAAVVTVVVALAALGLVSCGGGGGHRLTVYSGRTSDLIQPILDRFSEETGIAVDLQPGDSADLAVQIETEGAKSPADVFISQSPGATGYLADNDRLAKLPDDVLNQVPAAFRSERGDWVGLSGRVRVLVYNTDDVNAADLPDSVLDLTRAEYRGRVGVAPTNGSFQDFVTGMRGLIGDDKTLAWLEGMVANDVQTYANNDAILLAVRRGEIPLGLVNHYYNEQAKNEDPTTPTENHLFADGDPGTMILVTAATVLGTSDQTEDALRLVEFLLSDEAQKYFATETFEYPLKRGVAPAVHDLPALDAIAAPHIDLSSLGGGLQKTRELIRDSGLERA